MLGHAPLKLESHEVAVGELRRLLSFQERPLHEVGRAALLLLAMSVLPQDEHVACVDELFVRGDNAEREALLRTLPLLPDAARFLSTAGEACRTNVRTVFEAIACENPYPGLYFPESSFNQLIMKALFLGVPVRRIVGLPDRVTPALRRMAGDYARERIAAGRPVNEDAGWVQTL